MKPFFRSGIFFLTLLALASPVGAKETALPFDHSEWDAFLKKFVNEKGEVDYRAAQKDASLLNAYLEKLKSIPKKAFFSEWPREEQLAVLLNAYNAGIIKLILDHYPVKTVMDIPGVWDQPAIQIGRAEPGSARSPNQVQNELLRHGFRDEKIIFGLSSGARGSPRLPREAYVGPRVDGQLYLAAREFVNDEIKNRIKAGEKKIVLSRLFKWYSSDFLLNWSNFPEPSRWNSGEMAVLSFLAHYLQDPQKVEFLREGRYKVKYETFNWKLNDTLPS